MSIKNKVKAFTLPEVLVVMVLSGIAIGFIYNGYMLFNQMFMDFTRRQMVYEQYYQFQYLLNRDISQCKTLRLTGNTLWCEDDENSITYSFDQAMIVRNQLTRNDTINGWLEEVVFMYGGNPVHNNTKVDELYFKIRISENKYLEYRGCKIYDHIQKMNF